MGRLALAPVLLAVVCSTLVFTSSQTRAQTDYSMEVRGYTWDHTTITVSVIPKQNMSWWKLEYLNAALHGINQWNNAIQEFASNNTAFSFLSNVRFVASTHTENVSGFDVYIGWILECEIDATIGQTLTSVKFPCYAVNSTVCLTAKSPSGHVMTEVDMQNIVVHELGHALGLSHCNVSSDVMYPTVYYRGTVNPLSTLDVYAVAKIFEFETTSSCPEESVLTMPQDISYSHFQIAPENNPVSVPENLTEYAIGLLVRPEVLVLVGVVLIGAVIVAVKQRKVATTQTNPTTT